MIYKLGMLLMCGAIITFTGCSFIKPISTIEEQSSEELVKAEEESSLETDINIYNFFAQIETNGRHKLIEFPSVDIEGAIDIANIINERI